MKIDLSKSSHILFFVVLLPAFALSVGWLVARQLPEVPFWVETISPLGAYGLLYALFERRLWHWPVFRWLGIVSVPDLRGRWVGEQLSSYKKENGKPLTSRVVLEIEQTFSGIQTHAYYHRWNGSHSASCFLHIDGQQYLVIVFESEPGVHHNGDEKAHKGLTRLSFNATDGVLAGSYFNSNGNVGELRLKRTSKRLLRRFAA